MLLGHPIESSETRKYRMLGKDKTTTKNRTDIRSVNSLEVDNL